MNEREVRQFDGMVEWFLVHSETEDDFVNYMRLCRWTEEEAREEWKCWC